LGLRPNWSIGLPSRPEIETGSGGANYLE